MATYKITGGRHTRKEDGQRVTYSKGDPIEIRTEKEFESLKPYLGLDVQWNAGVVTEEFPDTEELDIPTAQLRLKEERAGQNRKEVVEHLKEVLRKLKEDAQEK